MQMDYNPDIILIQEHTEAEVQNYTGSFCGFVLLNGVYDLYALVERLQNICDIAALPVDRDNDLMKDLMMDVPGAMVTVSFMDDPIPEDEIASAAIHAVWEGASYAAKTHTAHLMIAVLPDAMSALDAGRLYCNIISAVLDDDTALAVYTSGTILDSLLFRQHVAEHDTVLLETLIFVGTYMREGGNCGYTVGLDAFGKDELELLDSAESSDEIRKILRSCAYKIIKENNGSVWYTVFEVDGVLWEGRRKDGVMVEGHSIQLNIKQ